MTTGADSYVVNGQLVTFPTTASYAPLSYGPQTNAVPNVTPAYPPYMGGTTGATPGSESIGGYGTAGNNSVAASIANAHPFNLRVSPTWWAVGGLLLALVLLKAIHWRETLEEEGGIGPVREEARESA
jgi:hypothetical protein